VPILQLQNILTSSREFTSTDYSKEEFTKEEIEKAVGGTKKEPVPDQKIQVVTENKGGNEEEQKSDNSQLELVFGEGSFISNRKKTRSTLQETEEQLWKSRDRVYSKKRNSILG